MKKYYIKLAWILSPFNIMVRECSWCKRFLGFKRGGRGITSGICKICLKEWEGIRK